MPDEGERSVVAGRIALIVKEDGRIARLAWEQIPLLQPLATAILRAALAADSAGAFDGIMREADANDTLSITIGSRRDTLPTGGASLLRARIASYLVDRPTMMVRMGKLAYPENARRQRVSNDALVSFIMGSQDRPYMPSFQVTRTEWPDFEPALRGAIDESTMQSARSGKCRVPQLVQQAFRFDATGRR